MIIKDIIETKFNESIHESLGQFQLNLSQSILTGKEYQIWSNEVPHHTLFQGECL